MKFLFYVHVDESEIETHLGQTGCRYTIVSQAFALALEEMGDVVWLDDPAHATTIYSQAQSREEACVLLSFGLPYLTPLETGCPVVPVFAWAFPDIPECVDEARWEGEPRHDWRHVFDRSAGAICLSTAAAEAVGRCMGESYPIAAISVPVQPAAARDHVAGVLPDAGVELKIRASVADSYRMGLNVDSLIVLDNEDGTHFHPDDLEMLPAFPQHLPDAPHAPWNAGALALPDQEVGESEWLVPPVCGWDLPEGLPVRLRLAGVIYTSILTPSVMHKNLHDMVSAFCWTFRDTSDVTLILRMEGFELNWDHHQLLMLLSKLSPMKCRVIAIYGSLAAVDHAAVVAATTYCVNASYSEGLCLPLVDFLNAGIPAIAPCHSAMADYINEDVAFVVASHPGEPTVWPHGDHDIVRTTRHQIDWQSLVDAYQSSHAVALNEPERYRRMGRAATEIVQAQAGPRVVAQQLRDFFRLPHNPVARSTPMAMRAQDIT